MAGIVVEHLVDEPGAPQAGIVVTGLDAGSPSIISVQVSWDEGYTWHYVRGANRESVVGAAFFRDFVPPLNVTATYRLIVHEGDVIPDTLEDTLLIESTVAWLQDPLEPRTAVQVLVECNDEGVFLGASSLSQATYEQGTDHATPMDSAYPISSVGRRAAASNVPIVFSHKLASEGGALKRLLMESGQVVLRGHPATTLGAVAHISMGTMTEDRFNIRRPSTGECAHQVSVWTGRATEEQPLAVSIVIPWWTYEQVAAIWAAVAEDTAAWTGSPFASTSTYTSGSTVITNLATNPRPVLGATNWNHQLGNGEVATITTESGSDGPMGLSHYRRSLVTTERTAGITRSGHFYRQSVTGTIGMRRTIEMWYRTSVDSVVEYSVSTRNAGAQVEEIKAAPRFVKANQWTRFVLTFQATVVFDQIQGFLATPSYWFAPVGCTQDATAVMIYAQAPGVEIPPGYVDGDVGAITTFLDAMTARPGDTYVDWQRDPGVEM